MSYSSRYSSVWQKIEMLSVRSRPGPTSEIHKDVIAAKTKHVISAKDPRGRNRESMQSGDHFSVCAIQIGPSLTKI